jgi:tape measure domain-containing protein
MSDKDMKLRLIVEAKNEAGAELERLHQQARRSGSAVAEAYQQAFALIGASTADVYGQMRLQYGADAAEFAQLTGDKETAYALYAKRLVELDRSAAASHRTLAAAAAEAFGSGIRAQADDFARSLVGVSSAAKTTEGVLGPLDKELDELRQATGLSSEAFADLQARFAQTTAEKAQENSLLSIAKAAVLSRAEIQQLGQAMGMNAGQIDRVTTAAHGAAPALNTLVSLSQSAQNGLSKTAEASVAGLAQDLTALSQGGRIAQTSLDGLGTELDELRRHSQLTDAQFAALQAKFQQTSAEKMQEQALRNLAASCNLTEQEIRELGNQFGLSRAQIESVVGSTKKAETSFLSLGTVARGALAYLSLQTLISFGRGVLDVTVQIDSLHRSLVAIYGSQSAAAAQMEFLRQTADRTGQNVYQLVDSYKTLSASTQGTILEGEATRKIFTAISEAGAVLGMSNERIKLSFMAISQMASKGTVNMEDLRQQLGESLPGALRLFAEGMGKSTEEFIAMVEKGEVLSADLIKLASAIHATYGEAAETAGLESAQGAINKMSEAWTDLKANLIESDTAVAGINAVTAALKGLSALLATDMNVDVGIPAFQTSLDNITAKELQAKRVVYLNREIAASEAEISRIQGNRGAAGYSDAQQQAIAKLNASLHEQQTELQSLEKVKREAISSPYVTGEAAGKIDIVTAALGRQDFVMQGVQTQSESTMRITEKMRQETLKYIETQEQALKRERDAAMAGAKTVEERGLIDKKYQEELTQLHEREGKAAESAAKKAAKAAEQQQKEYQSILDRLLPLEVAQREYNEGLAALIKMDPTQSTESYQIALANLNHEYQAAAESANRYAKEAEEAKKAMEEAQRAAAESELTRQGTDIEIALAQGQFTENEALPFQIDLLEQRLRLQQELLADMEKSTPQEITAWNSQAEAIARTTLELAEYQQRLRLLDPMEAFRQGLNDYRLEVDQEALDFYRNLLPDAIDESSSALAEFVRDVAQGNATLAEAWEALGESIENVVFDILEDLTAMYLKMSIMGLLGGAGLGGINLTTAGSTTSEQFSLDSIFGSVSGHHSGGVPGVDAPTFTRIVPLSTFMAAPRFHTGLKGNEFPAILEDGESVLTEGQMATIGKGLSAKSQAPQFNMTIVEAPGVKAETETSANDDGSFKVLVRMVESEVSQRMAKGQGLHKTMGSLYGARRKF